MEFLVYSLSKHYHLKPAGYTTDPRKAARFSLEEALAAHEASGGEDFLVPAPKKKTLGEIAWEAMFPERRVTFLENCQRADWERAALAVRDAVLDVDVEEMAKVIQRARVIGAVWLERVGKKGRSHA